MAKVLTIRDPGTGKLIAKEHRRPQEDDDTALVRIYRRVLGPNAPELEVLTRSIWPEDRKWAAELSSKWPSLELVLLVPKGETRLENAHLLLVTVSDGSPVPRITFPSEKKELDAIKHGQKHDAIVPVKSDDPPAVGDAVTFQEVRSDPFGNQISVPNGDSISVTLTEVKNQDYKWVDQDVYKIAWDPAQAKNWLKKTAVHGSK